MVSLPLKQSIASPDNEDQFGSQPFVLIPHSLKEHDDVTTANPNIRLVTQCSHYLPNEAVEKLGILRNTTIKQVNNQDFRRLLEFFNYRWVQNGSEVTRDPTVRDISKFLKEFKSVCITDNDSFSRFLLDFNLLDRFSVDPNVDVLINLNRFGWLLRSFVPIRFAPCEGQHRLWLMSSLLQGLPQASKKLPFHPVPLSQFPSYLRDMSLWQTKDPMRTELCSGIIEEESFQTAVQEYSRSLKCHQDRNVKFQILSFISKLCTDINTDWTSIGMRDCDFDHYITRQRTMEERQLLVNFKKLFEFLEAQITGHPTARKEPLLFRKRDQQLSQWSDVRKTFSDFVLKNFQIDTQKAGITNTTQFMIVLLKCFCEDRADMLILPSIVADIGNFENQRHPNQADYSMLLQSPAFFGLIRKEIGRAESILVQAFNWETLVLEHLRANYPILTDSERVHLRVEFGSQQGRAKPLPILSTNDFTRFPAAANLKVRSYQWLQKAKEMAAMTILKDFFECLRDFGLDPQIFPEEDINECATLTPAQFKAKQYLEGKGCNYVLKLYLHDITIKASQFKTASHTMAFGNWMTSGWNPDLGWNTSEAVLETLIDENGKPQFETKSNRKEVKYAMEILLNLYPFYVHQQRFPYTNELVFLKPFFGTPRITEGRWEFGEDALELSDEEKKGTGWSRTYFRQRILTCFEDILKNARVLFRHMIEDIKTGAFNTDRIFPFVEHMESQLRFSIWNELTNVPVAAATDTADGNASDDDSVAIQQKLAAEKAASEASAAEPPTGANPQEKVASTPAAKPPAQPQSTGGSKVQIVGGFTNLGDPIKGIQTMFKNDPKMDKEAQLIAMLRLVKNFKAIDLPCDFLGFTFSKLSHLSMKNIPADDTEMKMLMNQIMSDLGKNDIYKVAHSPKKLEITFEPTLTHQLTESKSKEKRKLYKTDKATPKEKRKQSTPLTDDPDPEPNPSKRTKTNIHGVFGIPRQGLKPDFPCYNKDCDFEAVKDAAHQCSHCTNVWCETPCVCYMIAKKNGRTTNICLECVDEFKKDGWTVMKTYVDDSDDSDNENKGEENRKKTAEDTKDKDEEKDQPGAEADTTDTRTATPNNEDATETDSNKKSFLNGLDPMEVMVCGNNECSEKFQRHRGDICHRCSVILCWKCCQVSDANHDEITCDACEFNLKNTATESFGPTLQRNRMTEDDSGEILEEMDIDHAGEATEEEPKENESPEEEEKPKDAESSEEEEFDDKNDEEFSEENESTGTPVKLTDDDTDWKAEVKTGNLQNYTVPELKVALGKFGKKKSGKKADLIERLKEAINEFE